MTLTARPHPARTGLLPPRTAKQVLAWLLLASLAACGKPREPAPAAENAPPPPAVESAALGPAGPAAMPAEPAPAATPEAAPGPAPAPASIAFVATRVTTSEAAGSVALELIRRGPEAGAVAVNYATRAGSAAGDQDFLMTQGNVAWPGGDGSPRTIWIPLQDDADVEGTETFDVVLSDPAGGAVLGAATATVSIEDDEPVPAQGQVGLTAPEVTVGESAGQVSLTFTRSDGAEGSLIVQYRTVNGTATAGSDFIPVSGRLLWNAGDDSSRTIQVPITRDAVAEGPETFSVELVAVNGGAVPGLRSTVVTIVEP